VRTSTWIAPPSQQPSRSPAAWPLSRRRVGERANWSSTAQCSMHSTDSTTSQHTASPDSWYPQGRGARRLVEGKLTESKTGPDYEGKEGTALRAEAQKHGRKIEPVICFE
jgi:hypothetical protein